MSLKLYDHQTAGAKKLTERERFYLAWSMGTGKTITVLSAINQIGGKTLVVCPLSVMRAAWLRDCEHFPGLRVQMIRANGKAKRLTQIRGEWDVAVVNHDLLRIHKEDFVAAGITRLVIDEASRCKNNDAAVTKAATWISDRCQSVWLLSGTPSPNCPTEWIPQCRIISNQMFGSSYWAAVNRYFNPIKRTLRDGRQIIERYTQSPEQAAMFQSRLKEWVWSLRKEDCLTLPTKTDVVVDVELDEEAQAYLDASENFVLLLKSGERSAIKREAALMKLRQIVGGGVKTGENDNVVGSSKLKALAEQLDAIGRDEPVVIWAEFRHEIRRIEEMIRERGESVDTIYGETSHRAGETVAAFQRGDIKRLVCHPASAGHGLTMTAASYTIYYSLSFSSEQHEQSRDRIHRVGQTRPCTYVYLIASGTVDKAMAGTLKKKQSQSAALAELLKLPVELLAPQDVVVA